MKKLFFFILILITISACKITDDDPVNDNMTITLTGLKPVTLNVTNGRVSEPPSDQNILYVSFQQHKLLPPQFEFELSPIPDSYDFILPKAFGGYDIFVSTFPNKLYKFKETWDMPKHLWTWQKDDVGSPAVGNKIQVNLERHSSNLIIKPKDGVLVPNDNVVSIRLMIDAVFDNYSPIYDDHYGLYERKWITLWPSPNGVFGWKEISMGLKDPYDSLGTFEFSVKIFEDHLIYDYIKYEKQFQLVGGKTTIIEVDLERLGVDSLGTNFLWTDEEEDIIIATQL